MRSDPIWLVAMGTVTLVMTAFALWGGWWLWKKDSSGKSAAAMRSMIRAFFTCAALEVVISIFLSIIQPDRFYWIFLWPVLIPAIAGTILYLKTFQLKTGIPFWSKGL